MDYDPNMMLCGRTASQTVKLTFQQWEYTAEIEQVVGGNCTGLPVIDCAVCNAYDDLYMHEDIPYIILTDSIGASLECVDEDCLGEDWLKGMLVKAEIISIEACD